MSIILCHIFTVFENGNSNLKKKVKIYGINVGKTAVQSTVLPSPNLLSFVSLSSLQSWTHNISKEKEFLVKLVKAGVIQDWTNGICGTGC